MTKKAAGNVGKVYKKYTEEFRRDAVRMIESEGLTTAEVSRRLGVNANLLRKWRQTYGKMSETRLLRVIWKQRIVDFVTRTVGC